MELEMVWGGPFLPLWQNTAVSSQGELTSQTSWLTVSEVPWSCGLAVWGLWKHDKSCSTMWKRTLLSRWNHRQRETGKEKEWGGKRGKRTFLSWEVLENFALMSQHCSPRRMRCFCLWLELQIFSLEHGGRFPSGSGGSGTQVQSWVWSWLVCGLPHDRVC